MSTGPYPAPIKHTGCPDCKGHFLNIWAGGRVHCGRCSMGGSILSPKYAHISLANEQEGVDAALPEERSDDTPILSSERRRGLEEAAKWHDTQAHLCFTATFSASDIEADGLMRARELHTKSAAAIRSLIPPS